jgi:predicted transcriptional regulator
MSKTAVITARVNPETLSMLDALAARMRRSRAWIVGEALKDYVADQTAFLDFVQEGVDDLDAGRTVTHEEMIRELEARQAKRRAA